MFGKFWRRVLRRLNGDVVQRVHKIIDELDATIQDYEDDGMQITEAIKALETRRAETDAKRAAARNMKQAITQAIRLD